jgi:hypothetical protein
MIARDPSFGPAFGFGYRYESGHLVLDASLFNFTLTQQNQSFDNLTGPWVRLGALFFFEQSPNPSLYGGAGLGWGISNAKLDGNPYTNNGLDFEFTVGYEALRANTVRLFLQLDASVPAYSAKTTLLRFSGTSATTARDSIYTPSFSLSLGIGFSKEKQ